MGDAHQPEPSDAGDLRTGWQAVRFGSFRPRWPHWFAGESVDVRAGWESAMTNQRIGIVHPGQMGAVVAISAQNSGNEVLWASDGRGGATRDRASRSGLRDAGTLVNLCELCPVIVSV